MFKKILIANRGEIACRVIKTARKMGIATVAVHSEADQDALFVELADEAVCIGPAPSKESYLVMDKIIAACKQTGAEAVHPGYGFLSENAEFSRRLEEEGIKFIGPKHYSVAKMGDKIESKKLAIEAGVNTIPGYNDAIAGPAEAVEIAKKIGYPVMIKASAGGGGKGLRVAFSDEEAFEGFASCVNEARNAFGDDRVFIEKYVLEPRHIEIQVLGDAHGNYVYLNERDCSIQRRHQKVIEEAPSPFVDPAMRRAMGEQAVALARAVNYESAGTVEFVVSGATKEFYFLEMNTRLQVEHPVTELITGLDLVEQMIRVAAGERLPLSQAEVKIDGWAMECRINAEDPFRGFLPSTGRLVRFQPPAEVPGQVRVDTGVYEGGEISMFYDSMIAKLIVHGATREQAIERMRDALNAFVIRGISSNIPFQAALLQHPRFCSGHFNTGFIAEEYPRGFDASMVPHDDPVLLAAVATFARVRYIERATQIEGQLAGHGRKVSREWVVVMAGRQYPVSTRPLAGGLEVIHEGRTYAIVSAWIFGDLLFTGTVNGAPICLQIERRGLRYRIAHFGLQVEPMVMTPRAARLLALMPEKLPPDLSKFLLSPMPGLLREVAVAEGQEVKAGEKLATIEAMKMENVLKAEQDGKVKKIVARPGASLSVDEVIIEFE
ncbi:acetyl-CoA carboxylase biotin carboxylase subunit [Thauera chlorobenzoica]|uniref:Biotin carboxylase n=1 Tax=Thauera chlorobenzoica TaxID=96773 RepID=A0A1H5XSE9_9RHOO|nr:acetyl-CoA carboxylase biotin carboxylase subunit [Thauera chlorobenzoica]APR04562.1 Propionyl-CoA carboxylase biotin-containing subunit [Thauera chlorobenzoica]SEG14651.1 propionyl-CoA carboxylase alpha chain [Thauera chlorobenzoica]